MCIYKNIISCAKPHVLDKFSSTAENGWLAFLSPKKQGNHGKRGIVKVFLSISYLIYINTYVCNAREKLPAIF